jgi:2-oxoglutarate dehydrogenase E2 component (dihydrolipoamide succinyltransferase)
MATIEMKVPSPGESITEVQIARWIKKDGDVVEKDEELCEIDSDKATLTLNAEANGTLKILVKEGETVAVGTVVCTINDSTASSKSTVDSQQSTNNKEESKRPQVESKKTETAKSYASGTPSVAAEKMMKENSVKAEEVNASGKAGRITKADVLEKINAKASPKVSATPIKPDGERNERREKMSMLRKRVAERLVAVKQETAMLTTFNEVDMSSIMNMRKQYKDKFKETHGVNLGFMSFFTKAVCEALKTFPAVNARIDGDEIVYHDYCDIGIAVSAPKGLMVPVIRNAESLSFAEIEQQVSELASKARDGKISIDEMTGGTFTITNGGVFGSMLSTPIINPPQAAILGMHNIVERPVALNGKVVIRPIMYVALSYDHRIIDGRESVSFLVRVKQMLEEPISMLIEGNNPVKTLLDL